MARGRIALSPSITSGLCDRWVRAARCAAIVWMLLKQIAEGRCEIENQYNRVVPRTQPEALAAVNRVYELRNFRMARVGSIDHSGVRLACGLCALHRAQFACRRSASPSQILPVRRGPEGRHQALECKVFRQGLHAGEAARRPYVSSEGACAAYYQFGHPASKTRDERSMTAWPNTNAFCCPSGAAAPSACQRSPWPWWPWLAMRNLIR